MVKKSKLVCQNKDTRLFVYACVVIFALIVLFSGCDAKLTDTVVCDEEPYNTYSDTIVKMLPRYTVTNQSLAVVADLAQGAVVEAYDAQAYPLLESNAASYWYPQYLGTAVIAVDRDHTDAVIKGWNDLVSSGEIIGVSDNNVRMMMLAMAYALEGERFTLKSTADILEKIHHQGNLSMDNYDAPVLICFDYQAAALARAGRRMEIIIPAEGTLVFEKGLLSKIPLLFADNPEALLKEGFRLLNGMHDASIYPDESEYSRAVKLDDYNHLNSVGEDVSRTLRRSVWHIRLYTSADGREHQLFALIFIILALLAGAAMVHRTVQKGIRMATLYALAMLAGWALLRMFKYQLNDLSALARYCWFVYYAFQIGISLILLWMAWLVDKPENVFRPPKWWFVLSILSCVLWLLIMTNDLHNLAFILDTEDPFWSSNYSYGPVYWVCTVTMLSETFAAVLLLIYKSRKSPRRFGFIFPLAILVLLVLYNLGYAFRIPIAWESDQTIVTGAMALLFLGACMRTGMIPVNTKYRQLFTHSPLAMQIVDDGGNVALASAACKPLNHDTWRQMINRQAVPFPINTDTLLYADPIQGGMVIWQEDIRAINKLIV